MNTISKKEIMQTAWTIARSAAAKFGGRVKTYIALAMRQAWLAAKTSAMILAEIAAAARALDCVYNVSVWKDRRVYVNLKGYNPRFTGDRNLKVFFEHGRGWVVEGLKGGMSNALAASLNAFAAVYGLRKEWY